MSAKSDLLLLSNSSVYGRDTWSTRSMRSAISWVAERRSTLPRMRSPATRNTANERVPYLRDSTLRLSTCTLLQSQRRSWEQAEVLFVGGGNSFRLLKALHDHDLVDVVRRRVEAGELSYVGSSAGTNMACPSVRTTNDMPIVESSSVETFSLIPFQINPHYLDPDPASTHMGETREKRIHQFHEENDVAVLGMREGAWLRREGAKLFLRGTTGARLFRQGLAEEEFAEGADLSFLLGFPTKFDKRIQKVNA